MPVINYDGGSGVTIDSAAFEGTDENMLCNASSIFGIDKFWVWSKKLRKTTGRSLEWK